MSKIKSKYLDFGTGTNQISSRNLPANYTPSNYTPSQVASEGTDKVSAHLKGIDTEVSELNSYFLDTLEPMGFINRTDSTLTHDHATRTFTISGTFQYYWKGIKFTKTAVSEQVVHGTGNGQYYIWYNGVTLEVSAVDTPWNLSEVAPVSIVYYNNTAAAAPWAGPESILFEERHGCTMDYATHLDLHTNIGTFILGSGFAINGTYSVATGTGGLVANSYGIDSGTIVDEDIQIALTTLTDNAGVGNQYPIFYRSGTGTEWRWSNTNLPLLKDGNNDLYYNQLNVATWQLTPITSNNTYYNMYVCAIPVHSSDVAFRYVWVMGQTTYTTLALAQAENIQNLNLAGFPFVEAAPLYRITMRYGTTYQTVSGKSRIEAVQRIVGTRLSISLSFNPQNHNNLSNRSDPNAHPGTAISFTPYGAVTATEMQTALQQTIDLVAPTNDLSLTSFTIVNNTSTMTDITGFLFNPTNVRSFQALVSVYIEATASLCEQFEVRGIYKGAAWDISVDGLGDESLIDFEITNAGQMQYTSAAYAGFVSGKMEFRAIVTRI